MTDKIFLKDSYAKECEAIVQKADGKFVVLDRTVFYPQGGGQPSDTGKILSDKQEYKVVDWKNQWFKVEFKLENKLALETAWVRNDLVKLISK